MHFYFHYQIKGGEDVWQSALATERDKVINNLRPAFTTVLDLTALPDDGDWGKVKYRGPFYADFDGEDLTEVCPQFKKFLAKLRDDFAFDLSQARLFATGGRGFHIEIPEECFMPKVPAAGTTWLPYIYQHMAQKLVVDTLDLNVYSGKQGRMWRTPGVKRDNGNYKVALTVEQALEITPESYAELVREPRSPIPTTPPTCNSKLAMLFESGKSTVIDLARTRKKRQAVARQALDPWRASGKTPPSIRKIMNGEDISEDVGFNRIAIQLAIYAAGAEMDKDAFLEACDGLCTNHVSDSSRYNTKSKRRAELARMFSYMKDHALYSFDTAPVVALLKKGTDVSDLGVVAPPAAEGDRTTVEVDGEDIQIPDIHRGMRRGVHMNKWGIFKNGQDGVEAICRATFENVTSFFTLDKQEFRGYGADLVNGKYRTAVLMGADTFTSATNLKRFFAVNQLSFQGGEPETAAILDIMTKCAESGERVYTYPREGFFVFPHPFVEGELVKFYLTQRTCISSLDDSSPDFFKLDYRPENVASSYFIDIHEAPDMSADFEPIVENLFKFSEPRVIADMVGWFFACHFRSLYDHLFRQFPLLQVYGEAGAGKTATVQMLGRLHWYRHKVEVHAAGGNTAFVLASICSTSTSAPMILDEYKPRVLRNRRGNLLEDLRELFRIAYNSNGMARKGQVNKDSANRLGIAGYQATAPIVFIGEAIEMETAIIDRSVSVNLSRSIQSPERTEAFRVLEAHGEVLSSLGRALIEYGFALDVEEFRKEFEDIRSSIEASQRAGGVDRRESPRAVYNRAVIVHGLVLLQRLLSQTFGDRFDKDTQDLIDLKLAGADAEQVQLMRSHGMSEISKVMNRISMLSREIDERYAMRSDQEFVLGEDWIEIRVERAYDRYRRFMRDTGDVPLFDTLEAFIQAFVSYSPVIDRVCANSELRKADPAGVVVRLSNSLLAQEGVQPFHI